MINETYLKPSLDLTGLEAAMVLDLGVWWRHMLKNISVIMLL
jgi:hypothetical protein